MEGKSKEDGEYEEKGGWKGGRRGNEEMEMKRKFPIKGTELEETNRMTEERREKDSRRTRLTFLGSFLGFFFFIFLSSCSGSEVMAGLSIPPFQGSAGESSGSSSLPRWALPFFFFCVAGPDSSPSLSDWNRLW
ncbi:hypothetical protein EYF80_030415 [Liparis tanakae]|uniref:Uncharacterized protein n=1 Tax=Liparis tanakae TaxID=230148 RepID=A0A4Z2H1S4_9TELE|nr:hypothetical protein EYF80_030415 [Liparis tanakae]